MEPIVFVKQPKFDPAVWRPDVPLIVLERCESKEQLCVWIAIRWLMAAFPRERGFGTRKIAARAKVNQKYITRWCDELIDLGLLTQVDEEKIANFRNARPVYTIPLHRLEQLSIDIVIDVLTHWGARTEAESQLDEQLSLDLDHSSAESHAPLILPGIRSPDPPRDQGHGASDPPRDQESDPPRDQEVYFPDPPRDQEAGFSDPPRDQTPDPSRDHGRKEGRKDHGRKDHARARKNQEQTMLAPPDPPTPDLPVLPKHPLDLWQAACQTPRLIDPSHLSALAAEYDLLTGGYGWYWVGRGILAAAIVNDLRSTAAVRKVLMRWHDEGSYGSDLPKQKEQRNGHYRPGISEASSGGDGRDRPGRSDRSQNRERSPGRSRGVPPVATSDDYSLDALDGV